MLFLGLGKPQKADEQPQKNPSSSGVVYDKAIAMLQGSCQVGTTKVTIDVASIAALDTFAELVILPTDVKDRGGFTPVTADVAHLATTPLLQFKYTSNPSDEALTNTVESLRALFSSADDIITLQELFTMFDLGALAKLSRMLSGVKVTPDAAALLAVAGSIQRKVDPLALLMHVGGYSEFNEKIKEEGK
jgi:hypothetical protein